MSVTDIIDSYFSGEKLESAWIVLAGAVALGAALYAQVTALHELEARDPARFSATEGARIATVVKSFGQYRLAYAVATLLALVFVFVIGRPVFHGLAVGMLILAALGYTIDFFAEERAREYQRGLADAGAIPAPAES
jgi:hypothetical protein